VSKNTWIHIGFPKCASTSLQVDFFSQCPAISYSGKYRKHSDFSLGFYRGPSSRLVSLGELHFREEKTDIEKELCKDFSDHPDGVRLISDETFVAGYLPAFTHLPVQDSSIIAHRLHNLYPNANILMIIRNQTQFLPALFAQIIKDNRINIDVDAIWQAQVEHIKRGLGSLFYIPDYNAIYDLYEEVFGKGRVHVLLLEDMLAEPLDSLKHIINLFGLTEQVDPKAYLPRKLNAHHTRLSKFRKEYSWLYKIYRSARWLVPTNLRRRIIQKLDRPLPGLEITDEREAFLNEFYGPGNNALQEKLFGNTRRLEELGYPMSRR
jgi:hypothetical protein